MGFSQFIDIINGGVLETASVAIDASLTDTIRAGAEVTAHWWESPRIDDWRGAYLDIHGISIMAQVG